MNLHFKLIATCFVLFLCDFSLHGQGAASGVGSLVGEIVDESTGRSIADASIFVGRDGGLGKSTSAGNYEVTGIASGTYDVRVFASGYDLLSVTGVAIEAGAPTRLKLALSPSSQATASLESSSPDEGAIFEMEAFTVTAEEAQNRDIELLVIRKSALGSIDVISSDALSRLAAGDAAEAIANIPGISVTGGKYAVIRGLNDRYAVVLLNGVNLPSPDPDRKAVQLDIFPSSLLGGIVTYKTFMPNLPGESSGGAIDLQTKLIPEEFSANLSFGLGYQRKATGNNDFPIYLNTAADLRADGAGERGFPAAPDEPFVVSREAPGADKSFSANYGNAIDLGNRGKLGVIAAASWSQNFDYRSYEFNRWSTSNLGNSRQDSRSRHGALEEGVEEVSMSGLLGLGYRPAAGHNIGYNLLYVRAGEDSASIGNSVNDENEADGAGLLSGELYYTQRSFLNHQLSGYHLFPEIGNVEFNWLFALGRNVQNEPAVRSLEAYIPTTAEARPEDGGPFRHVAGANSPTQFARRTDQDSTSYKADLSAPFQLGERSIKLSAGLFHEKTNRSFLQRETFISPFFIPKTVTNLNEILSNPKSVFPEPKQTALSSGESVTDAYYFMAEIPLTSTMKFSGGIRLEDTYLVYAPVPGSVTSVSVANYAPVFTGSPIDDRDFLPGVSLRTELFPDFFITLSYSQTVAKPTFKEIAPFAIFNQVTGEIEQGNPGTVKLNESGGEFLGGNPDGLSLSSVSNFDFRIEWFLNDQDVISLNIFQKTVDSPIERVDLGNPSIGNIYSFENNDNDAKLNGFEFEIKKGLGFLADFLDGFNVGANFTYISAEVGRNRRERINRGTLVAKSPTRRLQDQPEQLVNVYISYFYERFGSELTLSASYVGDRLYTVGGDSSYDVFEESYTNLNFVYTQDLGAGFSLKFTAKNLLEPTRKLTYDPDIVRSYNLNNALLDYAPNEDNTSFQVYDTFSSYSISLKYDF